MARKLQTPDYVGTLEGGKIVSLEIFCVGGIKKFQR